MIIILAGPPSRSATPASYQEAMLREGCDRTMYVCMHIYIYIYTHVYIHTLYYMYICIHVYSVVKHSMLYYSVVCCISL